MTPSTRAEACVQQRLDVAGDDEVVGGQAVTRCLPRRPREAACSVQAPRAEGEAKTIPRGPGGGRSRTGQPRHPRGGHRGSSPSVGAVETRRDHGGAVAGPRKQRRKADAPAPRQDDRGRSSAGRDSASPLSARRNAAAGRHRGGGQVEREPGRRRGGRRRDDAGGHML